LLSLLLALITSSLIYKFLQNQSRHKTIVTVPVVVSTCEIPARKVIHTGQVEVRYLPSDSVKGDVCSNKEEVVGKAALVTVPKGGVVSRIDIGEPSIKLGLSYVIPSYMRAVTVGIDEVSGVAGFLKPRDHVDVIGTFSSNGKATAKTVLQDVELLAIGPDVQVEKVTKKTSKPNSEKKTTATLAVAPEDAEKLVLADDQGDLRLVLRSQGDVLRVVTAGADAAKVSGIPYRKENDSDKADQAKEAKPSPRAAALAPLINPAQKTQMPRSAPQRWTPQLPPSPIYATKLKTEQTKEIQVIRGNKIETVEVEDAGKAAAAKTTKEVAGKSPSPF
jgi:pilus assembly protein CpaB